MALSTLNSIKPACPPATDASDAELETASGSPAISFARVVLVVTLFAAPWAFGAVENWAWVALGLSACCVLFLWALGNVQQGVLKVAWSSLYLPLGLFLVLGVIQCATHLTLDRSETQRALVLLAADLTFFFVTIQLFSTASGAVWRGFGLCVLVLAGSLGLFAILQFGAGEQQIYGEVATPYNLLFGPYVNPNHFAGLMEMLIPVSVFYIAERHQKRSLSLVVWLVVGAAVAVASLLLSGSRGGLLALLAELVIAVAVLSKAGRMRRSFAAMVAAMILLAVLLFTWVDPGFVAQKLGRMVTSDNNSIWLEWADFRKVVARDSMRIVLDHPVSGVGLGNFETAYPRYQTFPSELWIDYAHNDYVQAITETGLAGALLILLAVVLFVRQAIATPARGSIPEGGWIRLGAALGCCGMLVHSFFDFNLHIPANAAWFAVLAALAISNVPISPTRTNDLDVY